MECYKRLLVTIISLLKSFLRPFLFFFFFLFLNRRKKKRRKRIKVRVLCSIVHLSMNFPNTSRTIILDSPFVRRRNVEMSFIPSRGVESGFHALLPPAAAPLLPQDYIAIPLCNRRRYHAPFFIPFTSLCPLVTLPLSRYRPFVSSSLDEGRGRNLIWFPTWPARIIFAEGGGERAREGTVDITVVAGRNLSTHNAEIRAIRVCPTDLAFRGYIHF